MATVRERYAARRAARARPHIPQRADELTAEWFSDTLGPNHGGARVTVGGDDRDRRGHRLRRRAPALPTDLGHRGRSSPGVGRGEGPDRQPHQPGARRGPRRLPARDRRLHPPRRPARPSHAGLPSRCVRSGSGAVDRDDVAVAVREASHRWRAVVDRPVPAARREEQTPIPAGDRGHRRCPTAVAGRRRNARRRRRRRSRCWPASTPATG